LPNKPGFFIEVLDIGTPNMQSVAEKKGIFVHLSSSALLRHHRGAVAELLVGLAV
jgi:hypothetical protein